MKSYVETTEFKVGELVDVSPFVSRVRGPGMIIEVLTLRTFITGIPYYNYKVLFGDKIVVLSSIEISKYVIQSK